MKRILVAAQASDVKVKTVDFACYIARVTDSDLVCALIDGIDGADEDNLKDPGIAERAILSTFRSDLQIEPGILRTNKKIFEEACTNRGVNCEFLPNLPLEINELLKESRFSDLIIIDPTISFENRFEGIPSVFVEQLLKRTECPVIVAPESFDVCEEIIFAYDGSKSSMFAIRQFTNLFPELRNVKLTVLEVGDENNRFITEMDRLAEWLKNYYSNVDYKLLYGRPKDELFGYLLEKQKAIVVMGAFGRTMLSSLLSKSNAELILKALNLPVFISHT
jgi:nucleotide-binding universal stress UspA family protein